MHILLVRVGPHEEWQPLAHLAAALADYSRTAIGIVTQSQDDDAPVGTLLLPETLGTSQAFAAPPLARTSQARAGSALTCARTLPSGATAELREPRVVAGLAAASHAAAVGWLEGPGVRWQLLLLPLSLPPRLLLMGAGPDALPVVDFAARLQWRVSVADHRPAYAVPSHFPLADRIVLTRPEEIAQALDLNQFTAAVVMSHHLPSDLQYLRALSASSLEYIGLLGPPARREKLLSELGSDAERLRPRLRAPVGFDLGGRTPEAIALAIVAEIHAFVHGRRLARSDVHE